MATLNDNALTTLTVVKDELSLTTSGEDDYLTRQINRYSRLFAEATDRQWYRKDGHTEKVTSSGDTRIYVHDHRPILAVNSVTVYDDTIDSGDYEIEDADKGWIRLDDDFWDNTRVAIWRAERYEQYGEFRIEVDYDGGYVTPKQVDDATFSPRTLPEDIEGAVIDTVTNKYRRKGAHSGISSESIGSASVGYTNMAQHTDQVLGANVSSSFAGAVARYKDRSVLP